MRKGTFVSRNHSRTEPESFDLPQPAPVNGFLQIALRRKSLIALGAVLGALLGALYYFQATAIYKSSAQILVVKKHPETLPITGMDQRISYYEDYLSTHLVLIKSPRIVAEAVKKHHLEDLPSFRGQGDPSGAIAGGLSVSRNYKDSTGTFNNIVDLAYSGPEPEEAPKIINAVIDSYKDYLNKEYRSSSEDTLDLITKAKDVLEKYLTKAQADYQKFKETTPLVLKSKGGVNVHRERLSNIEMERKNLLFRRARLEGHLSALEEGLKKHISRQEMEEMMYNWSSRPGQDTGRADSRDELTKQLVTLSLKKTELLKHVGPGHPDVLAVEDQINTTRELYQGRSPILAKVLEMAASDDEVAFERRIKKYLASHKNDLTALKVEENTLNEYFDREYTQAKTLSVEEAKEQGILDAIDRYQQLYKSILKQLDATNLAQGSGGYVADVISPPGPGYKTAPKLFSIATMSIFLGLLGGFALAYLAEISDKSFRTADEIHLRLGVPVVGNIPTMSPNGKASHRDEVNGSQLHPMLATHYQIKSPEAEAYRSVRTSLYFSTRGEGHKLIQIASPNMGDGKSTLAANLAISIAQSDKSIVLLDADFRRPTIHTLFNVPNQVGLASVLSGQVQLKEAIQPSEVPGLSILPCGPIPPNPAELLTLPQFKDLLDQLRQQFDFVLIDSSPILVVTDACVVAPRVDGVLMVIRASKNGRPRAQRAKEILESVGAKILGIVVNATDDRESRSFGYYETKEGYGY